MYYGWSKEFLEAGKRRLAGDTVRAVTSDLRREAQALKEIVADLTLENHCSKHNRGWGRRGMRYLVWQCRYSGVEVPDSLCSCADLGVGKLYADDQADALESEPAALAAFDESTHRFTQHVGSKGNCRGCRRCCPRRKVHHPIIVRQPTHPGRDESSLRNFLRGISVFRVERRKGPWLDTPSPHPTT